MLQQQKLFKWKCKKLLNKKKEKAPSSGHWTTTFAGWLMASQQLSLCFTFSMLLQAIFFQSDSRLIFLTLTIIIVCTAAATGQSITRVQQCRQHRRHCTLCTVQLWVFTLTCCLPSPLSADVTTEAKGSCGNGGSCWTLNHPLSRTRPREMSEQVCVCLHVWLDGRLVISRRHRQTSLWWNLSLHFVQLSSLKTKCFTCFVLDCFRFESDLQSSWPCCCCCCCSFYSRLRVGEEFNAVNICLCVL